MSATAWSHLGLLLATVPGFAALALAMERHQQDMLGQILPARRSRWLRRLGWVMLALALALAIRTQGLALGLVSWVGHLSLAAWLVYLGLVVLERWRTHRKQAPTRSKRPRP